MTFPHIPLSAIARPVSRPVTVVPGMSYRTIGVKWWGEGAYERETIDGTQTSAATLSLVREGDLIINKIWVRHGSTAIAAKTVDGCAASGEFPTFELDRDQVLPQWIHWQSKTRYFWTQCDRLSQGTSGKNRIKPELFLTIAVPLPPLDEQRRIVARIEELAGKIEEARGLQKAVAADSYRVLQSIYGQIIHGVDWLPMGEVAPLERRPEQVDMSEDYLELGVRSFGKGTFHKPPINGTTLGSKRIFRIEPGDLLFNIVFAWEGAVAVAAPGDQGRVGSHRFLTCVPKAGVATSSFLRFHFLTEQGLEQLGKASPGGAGRNRTLGLKALEGILVPVPPFETQEWFDSIHAKVDMLKQAQAESTTEIDALLPAILDKAFKGEL